MFVLNANFSKYSRDEWVKQKHCFGPKPRNWSFLEVSAHFHKKEVKKSKFKTFTGSSLTLLTQRVAGSVTGGVRGWSPLPCTHGDRKCKKPRCFRENWMNFLKRLVLTLNSRYLWRYNRLKLKLPFLFFLNTNFSKYSRAE